MPLAPSLKTAARCLLMPAPLPAACLPETFHAVERLGVARCNMPDATSVRQGAPSAATGGASMPSRGIVVSEEPSVHSSAAACAYCSLLLRLCRGSTLAIDVSLGGALDSSPRLSAPASLVPLAGYAVVAVPRAVAAPRPPLRAHVLPPRWIVEPV